MLTMAELESNYPCNHLTGRISAGNLAGILGGLVAGEAGGHLPEFWGTLEHSFKVEPAVAVYMPARPINHHMTCEQTVNRST